LRSVLRRHSSGVVHRVRRALARHGTSGQASLEYRLPLLKQEMVHGCKTRVTHPDQIPSINVADDERLENIESSNYLTIRLRYIVLPCSSAGALTDAQIQAQHAQLNLNYIAFQASTDFPSNTTHYPYQTTLTDPKIVFQPFSSNQVTTSSGLIQRLSPPTGVEDYSSIQDVLVEYTKQGHRRVPGWIYVFITTLGTTSEGQLLGEAEGIVSTACMVDYSTVGSPTVPGPSDVDGFGGTMIHELGHCLGLIHPFSESTCDSALTAAVQLTNPEGPKQINPNFTSDITGIASSDNGLDNRGRDYLRFCTGCAESATCGCNSSNGLNGDDAATVAAYSCASRAELSITTTPYETFMIYMDYGDDVDKVGFPAAHVTTMRHVLLNNPSLFSIAQLSSPSDTPTFPKLTAGSKFPTWAIGVIAAAGSIVIIIVATVLALRAQGKLPTVGQAPVMPHTGPRPQGQQPDQPQSFAYT